MGGNAFGASVDAPPLLTCAGAALAGILQPTVRAGHQMIYSNTLRPCARLPCRTSNIGPTPATHAVHAVQQVIGVGAAAVTGTASVSAIVGDLTISSNRGRVWAAGGTGREVSLNVDPVGSVSLFLRAELMCGTALGGIQLCIFATNLRHWRH